MYMFEELMEEEEVGRRETGKWGEREQGMLALSFLP